MIGLKPDKFCIDNSNTLCLPFKQRNLLENSSLSLGVGCVEILRSEARMRQAVSSLIRRCDIASVRATLNQKINSVSFLPHFHYIPPCIHRPGHPLFAYWFDLSQKKIGLMLICNVILRALLLIGKYCAASRSCTSCRCWNVEV